MINVFTPSPESKKRMSSTPVKIFKQIKMQDSGAPQRYIGTEKRFGNCMSQ
jgi:hypothetical protein